MDIRARDIRSDLSGKAIELANGNLICQEGIGEWSSVAGSRRVRQVAELNCEGYWYRHPYVALYCSIHYERVDTRIEMHPRERTLSSASESDLTKWIGTIFKREMTRFDGIQNRHRRSSFVYTRASVSC